MDDPFSRTKDPKVRADRYQKMACDMNTSSWPRSTASPVLRASFQHSAEEYRIRAQSELRVLEREGTSAVVHPRP